jgi:hypothetical protein
MNRLLNKLQYHVFICSIWINFEKQNVCWSLNFLNSFISKIINLHFLSILSKSWSGLVVKALVHLPMKIGFKHWWMRAWIYVMCIYIDVSCINMVYKIHMMMANIFYIYIYIYKPNINITIILNHNMLWKKFKQLPKKKGKKNIKNMLHDDMTC